MACVSNEIIPYGIEGFCCQWSAYVQRIGPEPDRAAYRCTMVVETYFGPQVLPGRELSAPVRLTRSRALRVDMRATGEFEISLPGRVQPGRVRPKTRAQPGLLPGRLPDFSSPKGI